jgi:hypothetical protein
MPAAKWFDAIILSDYTPANLEAQKKWLNKDKDAADWTHFFKHYSKLDGNEYVDHEVRNTNCIVFDFTRLGLEASKLAMK